MTVKELRDKLATLPDDMPVWHEYDMHAEQDVTVCVAPTVVDLDGDRVFDDEWSAPDPVLAGEVCVICPPRNVNWVRGARSL